MKLTPKQTSTLYLLSNAYLTLSNCWNDELGELLGSKGLLPMRDLTEANLEVLHIIEDSITN